MYFKRRHFQKRTELNPLWISNPARATRIAFCSILFITSSLLLHHFYFFHRQWYRTTKDGDDERGTINDDEQTIRPPFSASCSSHAYQV
jgi:hypothetical protein